jgi:hypothetical protein
MVRLVLLIVIAVLTVVSAMPVQAAAFSEGFESGMPSGWLLVNNSNELGINGDWQAGWHQSEANLTEAPPVLDIEGFGPNSGNYFACARDASCVSADSSEGNIDTWMLTPNMTFSAGDTLTFFTRAFANNSDSLEIRLSLAGASTNCGVQAVDIATAQANFPALLNNVGDFTTLLTAIDPWNPDGTSANNYPTVWTQYSITLPTAGEGRIGFRYLVFDGGYTGANSWVIGVDDVALTAGVALLPGDANGDHKVSFADYVILEQNFGKTGMTWAQADFNNDGKVSFADYVLLEQNFGKSIPEPATIGLLIAGGLAMLRRRR